MAEHAGAAKRAGRKKYVTMIAIRSLSQMSLLMSFPTRLRERQTAKRFFTIGRLKERNE